MNRPYLRAAMVGVLSAGLLAAAPPAQADVSDVDVAGDIAASLDLPAGITVEKHGTSDQMFGVATRSFNDFPRRGSSSYTVMSTGRSSDLFNTDLAGLQPSTSFGGARDSASLTFTVGPEAVGSCLLLDVAMATEERVHTLVGESDHVGLSLNGSSTQFALHPGPRYFHQVSLPAEPEPFTVNDIKYWHGINKEFERQPDDVDAPLLSLVTPFDNFTSVETLSVPLTANDSAVGSGPDVVTLSISDAKNDSQDSALMVDRVRLAPVCAGHAEAETGLYPTRDIAVVGHRGVNNILTVDLFPETSRIERYDAADNSWYPNGQVDLRFRWFRARCAEMPSAAEAIPDADRQSYSPTIEDKGKCLMVLVTGLKDGYRTETYPSPNNWNQVVTLPIQEGVFTSEDAPTISRAGDLSVIKVNDLLTASNGVFTPRPDSYEYQWYADNLPIAGESGKTFKVTSAQAGKKIKVRVTAARLNFNSMPVFSAETNPVDLMEFITTPVPAIEGTGKANETLTAVPGTWQPEPDARGLTYQWFADGSPITGATDVTFVPKAAQVGKRVIVAVTGKKAGYLSVTKQSVPIAITLQGFDAPRPVISGTGVAGTSLSIQQGTWTPTPTNRAYQWFDDDGAISGATNSTYTPSASQAGSNLFVEVTGKKDGYQDTTVSSLPIVVTLNQFSVDRGPSITGDGYVGSVLGLDRGSWTPSPGFTQQWFANGREILGATRTSFTPTEAERGKSITVRVTGTRSNYKTITLETDPVAIDMRTFMAGTPVITGVQRVGSRLSASPGAWVPSAAFSYRWKLGTQVLGRSSYLEVPAQAAGKRITLEVTGSRAYYVPFTATKTSATIAYGTLTASTPRVSGSARPGKTLRVSSSWRPGAVAVRYQWYAGSRAIKGATKSSYKVSKKYRGKKIRVRVTGSKTGYKTVSRYSAFKKIAKK